MQRIKREKLSLAKTMWNAPLMKSRLNRKSDIMWGVFLCLEIATFIL